MRGDGPRRAGRARAAAGRADPGRVAPGRAGAGSRLPTERQLALDLGVTRSSVRHALALLEAQGRISREVGRGTFLREPAPGEPGLRAAGGRRARRAAGTSRPPT